jgi:hypothetical protein
VDTTLEPGRLVARVDDERLSDGTYELRARAFDRAGNERTTLLRSSGQKMEIVLPLRAKTRLRAGLVRRSAPRGRHGRSSIRLLRRARVRFGRQARAGGRLTDAHGLPIPNADVLVFAAPRSLNGRYERVATLRTSHDGRLSYVAAAGPSRTLRFRYPGTATVRPAKTDVGLLVAGRTTLAVNRHFALNGETVTFRGRLRGAHVPRGGKLVELQALVRGRWRTFATARTDRVGKWRYSYRFDGTRGRQTYRFRAQLPRESTYPYETGHSRRISVTVVGL